MKLSLAGLIRNEATWIVAHTLSVIDYVHEFIWFDGNSTDGTLELLADLKAIHPNGHKINVFKNEDPANLQDAYVAKMNEAIGQASGDYVMFSHPDMIFTNPELIPTLNSDAVAFTVNMRSFAGEPDGKLYEFTEGRTNKWKPIHKNALGLHYFGHYGAANEDLYHSAYTGDEHKLYQNIKQYPFKVEDSGLNILHFSDVRPYGRRLDRMTKCLVNQGISDRQYAYDMAKRHPRVTLESSDGGQFGKFKLEPAEYPPIFEKARQFKEFACTK